LKIFKLPLVIWDVTSEQCKNRIKTGYAVEHLAEKYQMPHHEMEKKIHNLKSQFTREHQKCTESKKTGSSPKKRNRSGSNNPLDF